MYDILLVMNRLTLYSIFTLLLMAGIIYSSSRGYRKQKRWLETEIVESLHAALKVDLAQRLDKSGLEYTIDRNYSPNEGTGGRAFMWTELDTVIPYDSATCRAPVKEREYTMFQTVLTKEYPIAPCGVDTMFRKELKKWKITGETNVCIQVNGVESFCKKNSRVDAAYFATPVITIDFTRTTSVQAFVKVDSRCIWLRMDWILVFDGCVAGLCLLGFVLLKRKADAKKAALTASHSDEKPGEKDSGRQMEKDLYQFADFLFDSPAGCLRSKDGRKEWMLTPQLSDLLVMFITAPGYAVKIHDIVQLLWSGENNCDTLEKTKQAGKVVSKLRRLLKETGTVDIEKRRQVYVLKLHSGEVQPVSSLGNGVCRIGACVFDAPAKTLSVYGGTTPVSPAQVRLLTCLLKAPDYFATNEELVAALFGTKVPEEAADGLLRLQETIGGINKLLSKDECVEIVPVAGTGYRLLVKTDKTSDAE